MDDLDWLFALSWRCNWPDCGLHNHQGSFCGPHPHPHWSILWWYPDDPRRPQWSFLRVSLLAHFRAAAIIINDTQGYAQRSAHSPIYLQSLLPAALCNCINCRAAGSVCYANLSLHCLWISHPEDLMLLMIIALACMEGLRDISPLLKWASSLYLAYFPFVSSHFCFWLKPPLWIPVTFHAATLVP